MALKIPKKGKPFIFQTDFILQLVPAHPRLQGFEFGFIAHLHEAAWVENPWTTMNKF